MREQPILGGAFTFAGTSLTVNRMGYGAMQLAGQDGDKRVWGPPRDIPLFALLFLMPDVSMVGYLANAQIGAAVYKAVHIYLGPPLLGAYSVSTDHRTPLRGATSSPTN